MYSLMVGFLLCAFMFVADDNTGMISAAAQAALHPAKLTAEKPQVPGSPKPFFEKTACRADASRHVKTLPTGNTIAPLLPARSLAPASVRVHPAG
jgi:hypothetical protein